MHFTYVLGTQNFSVNKADWVESSGWLYREKGPIWHLESSNCSNFYIHGSYTHLIISGFTFSKIKQIWVLENDVMCCCPQYTGIALRISVGFHLHAEVVIGILINFILEFSSMWYTSCSLERKIILVHYYFIDVVCLQTFMTQGEIMVAYFIESLLLPSIPT
jgi:hypothetical protein